LNRFASAKTPVAGKVGNFVDVASRLKTAKENYQIYAEHKQNMHIKEASTAACLCGLK